MAYRIAILYLVSVLALLALLGAGVYLVTERTLVGALESDLQAQARRDAAALGAAATVDPSGVEGTARALAPALASGRGTVRIFNTNGGLIVETGSLGARPSLATLHALPPRLLTLGLRGADEPGRLYAAAPVQNGSAVLAVVEVSQARDEIDRVLTQLGQAFAGAGLLAVGLALAAGALLARSIVAPVRRLERVAGAIAGGDLARRVTAMPANELGALGTSFNQMATRLADLLAQARAEQERLTAILTGLADGVLAIDPAGRITLENPAAREVLGVPPGAPPATLADACAALGLPALWARARQGRAPVELEINPAGRSVLAVAAPVQAGAAGATGCVCVLRDITRVRESEQGRAAVLRRLGHELRTPLTALQATVSNLVDEATPAQAPALAVVEEEAARLARLVEELLQVARGPASGNLQLRPVDLRALAAATSALFATRADRLGVTLEVGGGGLGAGEGVGGGGLGVGDEGSGIRDQGSGGQDQLSGEGGPVIVRGDPDRLRQVLVNLLDNALRFTPAGGSVIVRVGAVDGEAALAVRDSGAGMDLATSRWAFEPYYQGPPAPAPHSSDPDNPQSGVPSGPRNPQSAGLGLAIVREIVTAHGGRLTLDTAPGAGTTVTVRLPLL
jgi:signal transduction histidine kinase